MSHDIEIERKYLLDGLPDVPADAVRVEIEQGYLDAQHVPADVPGGTGEHIREGRIRRSVYGDGRVQCTHTIKRGFGLVREEIEHELREAAFEKLWPATWGMRLRKSRWMLRLGEAVWAVDQFRDIELVLAEVEVPREDFAIEIPPWLSPHIVRDVTDEVEFVNSNIARRLGQATRQ